MSYTRVLPRDAFNEANCNLIAAAPDLLQACKNAYAFLIPLQSKKLPKDASTTVALQLLKQAINKAEGN